jgi:hypothetical protein
MLESLEGSMLAICDDSVNHLKNVCCVEAQAALLLCIQSLPTSVSYIR